MNYPLNYSMATCRRCQGVIIHRDDLIDHNDAPPELAAGKIVFYGCQCKETDTINIWFKDVPRSAMVIWGEKEI